MIKKAKVIAQYLVNMYCDKCGALLEAKLPHDIFLQSPYASVLYLYKCRCGWETTSEHSFPYTIVEYDLGNAEIIEED